MVQSLSPKMFSNEAVVCVIGSIFIIQMVVRAYDDPWWTDDQGKHWEVNLKLFAEIAPAYGKV